jgi:hypothetical protein
MDLSTQETPGFRSPISNSTSHQPYPTPPSLIHCLHQQPPHISPRNTTSSRKTLATNTNHRLNRSPSPSTNHLYDKNGNARLGAFPRFPGRIPRSSQSFLFSLPSNTLVYTFIFTIGGRPSQGQGSKSAGPVGAGRGRGADCTSLRANHMYAWVGVSRIAAFAVLHGASYALMHG